MGRGCGARARRHVPRYVPRVLTRKIPRTGEELPVIGLGTWQTFDVGPNEYAPREQVVRTFLDAGARLIDSSPMYGRAEETTGNRVAATGGVPFLATKVWTSG